MDMTVNRREFLKASTAAGGAIAFEFSVAGNALAEGAKGAPRMVPAEVTHWLVI